LFLVSPSDVSARLQLTIDSWRHWSDQVDFDGDRRDQVVRSGLALKTLLMARTGSIAAAATTSLPERVGGPKNWDYRYAWVRDATLAIEALACCGLQEEVHAAMTWLLQAVRDHGRLDVMYRLDGSRPDSATEVEIPGYRRSRPVRIGNGAVEQVQLGAFGDLFDAVVRWVDRGHLLDNRSAAALADLADTCADTWQRDDSGLWELGTHRPYTASKMSCWRALDVAARLAQDGHIGGHLGGHGGRWRREAERIRGWLEEHCWSEAKQSWTWYAGCDDLDAAVLLASRFGFADARMSTTVDAVSRELGVGPLVYRYTGAAEEEETFLACAYWRVGALARVGRLDEAESLMGELDRVGGPLGLLSEMVRPADGQLVGNVPQALSHLALIDAAVALRRARRPETARPRHHEQEGAR
jgi:GH15 family glucan-1,4-alpha-glucosidase